jgi:hypothetical protein
MGKPVVLCAVDWVGIRNDAHLAWRRALARAAHTVPENVALQCVHPHNAPFADTGAERLLRGARAPSSLDLKYFDRVVERTSAAAKASLAKTQEFTHIGLGQGKVEKVASNRRVIGSDGKIKFWRGSATKDAKARAQPEGLIDPWLKTLSFWHRDRALAALHYYATHPMSYYGDGQVSSDFCGLARKKRQQGDPNVFQIYFTGCAGNIAAGKYNDGARENRPVLRDRIYAGMLAAWKATKRHPVKAWEWRIEPVKLPPRSEKSFGLEQSRKLLEDAKQAKARRGNAAYQIAWLNRLNRPIALTCLDLGKAQVLHLPGEPFIEYQLRAQRLRKDCFVCVAGYGDDGPGYIPPASAYLEGGYETTVALSGPGSEEILNRALGKLLKARHS